jgi:hypothetical protein
MLFRTLALASKQGRAGDALCEQGNVVAGRYEASTGFPTVDHEEAPLEAGEVERGSKPGRPASDHEAVKRFSVGWDVDQAARGASSRCRPNFAASATSSMADITFPGPYSGPYGRHPGLDVGGGHLSMQASPGQLRVLGTCGDWVGNHRFSLLRCRSVLAQRA